jgi:hypothetical protein
MPSKSKAQHNLMEGVAHNAAFAKKVGIPQSVGRDFADADKGKKFSKGGASSQPKQQSINQPKTNHGGQALFKQGGTMATKMGKPVMKPGMSTAKDGMKKPTPMAGMMGMKKGGAPVKKMAAGGLSSGHKSANGIASKGKTKGMQVSMPGNKGLKKGGMAKKYC